MDLDSSDSSKSAQEELTSEEEQKKKWVPLVERERLSFCHIMGITIGTLASTLLFNILYTLFAPLCVKLKISNIARTMILLSGGVIGFTMSPMFGSISDGVTFKWGRRRIFMVVGGICVVLGLLVMMFCVELGEMARPHDPLLAQQAIMITALEFTMIAGNAMQTPARTLCTDVTRPAQQVLVSSCVVVYSGLGGCFTNLVGGLALYKYTGLSQESFILVVGLVIVAISLTITIIVTPEERLKEKPAVVNPLKSMFLAFRHMPKPIWMVGIPYFFSQIATYQIGFQLTDFMGRTVMKGDNAIDAPQELIDKYQAGVSWAMMCNVMNYGVQFLYSFVHTYVCKWIGMKYVFMILMLLLGVMYLLFFFIKTKLPYLFMMIPVGLASVAYLSIPQAIVSLCVTKAETGIYLGSLYCFGTAGQQFSNFVIGMGGGAIWPNQPGTLIAVSCVFAFLSGLLCLLIIVPDQKNTENQTEGDQALEPIEEDAGSDAEGETVQEPDAVESPNSIDDEASPPEHEENL